MQDCWRDDISGNTNQHRDPSAWVVLRLRVAVVIQISASSIFSICDIVAHWNSSRNCNSQEPNNTKTVPNGKSFFLITWTLSGSLIMSLIFIQWPPRWRLHGAVHNHNHNHNRWTDFAVHLNCKWVTAVSVYNEFRFRLRSLVKASTAAASFRMYVVICSCAWQLSHRCLRASRCVSTHPVHW